MKMCFLIRFDSCHTGVGVEGILRQSADVEDVERRVRDYEQGDNFLTILFLLKKLSLTAWCTSSAVYSPHIFLYYTFG